MQIRVLYYMFYKSYPKPDLSCFMNDSNLRINDSAQNPGSQWVRTSISVIDLHGIRLKVLGLIHIPPTLQQGAFRTHFKKMGWNNPYKYGCIDSSTHLFLPFIGLL